MRLVSQRLRLASSPQPGKWRHTYARVGDYMTCCARCGATPRLLYSYEPAPGSAPRLYCNLRCFAV